MDPRDELNLPRYFNVTLVCSQCPFVFPLPPNVEGELQKVIADIPGLICTDMKPDKNFLGALAECPSCKAPTILRITSVPING